MKLCKGSFIFLINHEFVCFNPSLTHILTLKDLKTLLQILVQASLKLLILQGRHYIILMLKCNIVNKIMTLLS